jgi:predicted MPP superfamily phosphohydrolase
MSFPRLTRRGFLRLATRTALYGGAAGTLGYMWRIEPHWVEVVRRDLPIANLPAALVGRTLVQISDLHVGPVVDADYITRAVRQASALGADILVVTGDFMTSDSGERLDDVARVLENLQPGRLATLAILGNHDYGPTWKDARVADQLCRRLPDLGLDVLRNDCRDVEGLQVVGLDDLWGPNWDHYGALSRLDPEGAALVLCHNPDGVDTPAWAGYRGWILSGHTHGGQCKPPFLPPPLLPVRNRRYTAGEFDLYDGRRLYINRGLGYLKRVRFNVRPEITVFTLQPAASA